MNDKTLVECYLLEVENRNRKAGESDHKTRSKVCQEMLCGAPI